MPRGSVELPFVGTFPLPTSILILAADTSLESAGGVRGATRLPPSQAGCAWPSLPLLTLGLPFSEGKKLLNVGSLGVFGVSGIGGATFVGDLLVDLTRPPLHSSIFSRSRDGSFSMESLFVMVPEEWMMLASSSFMMKLTVFFFLRSVVLRALRRSVAVVSRQLPDSEPLQLRVSASSASGSASERS